mgnify:FL=1
MKKTTLLLMSMAFALLLTAFASCNDDDDKKVSYYAYVTLHADDPANFWFEGDSGMALLPNHNKDFNSFKVSAEDDSLRTIVYFSNLAAGPSANSRTIDLQGMRTMVTKKPFVAHAYAELDSLGDDELYARMLHLSTDGVYLDTRLETPNYNTGDKSETEYVVSLVENTLVNHAPDYVNLELRLKRKNASGEPHGVQTGYVAFRLPDTLNPVKRGLKGLYVRVRGEEQIKYIKVTPKGVTVDRTEDVKK